MVTKWRPRKAGISGAGGTGPQASRRVLSRSQSEGLSQDNTRSHGEYQEEEGLHSFSDFRNSWV